VADEERDYVGRRLFYACRSYGAHLALLYTIHIIDIICVCVCVCVCVFVCVCVCVCVCMSVHIFVI
jgi:hypothetical protein